MSRVLQTKFAPGFLALFTVPVTLAQQPFGLTSVDIAESLFALIPFFSNAAVQAAIERGLSEVACALVQSKMLHKGATATRRLFTNPSIVCNPAKSTRFRGSVANSLFGYNERIEELLSCSKHGELLGD